MTDTTTHQTVLDARALDGAAWDQLFREARSNTAFDSAPVDPAVIHEVYDRIKFGPTGNNAGPMRLVVAASPEARATVIRHASPGNQPKLKIAPLLLVVARDDRYHDHLSVTAPGSEGAFERLEGAPEERAQKAHDGTWLQSAYLILGLRAAGLAVRPYGGFDKAGITESLLPRESWQAEMLLGVGYPPAGDHGAGERKGRVAWEDAAAVL